MTVTDHAEFYRLWPTKNAKEHSVKDTGSSGEVPAINTSEETG
jgi:hypothetical protein